MNLAQISTSETDAETLLNKRQTWLKAPKEKQPTIRSNIPRQPWMKGVAAHCCKTNFEKSPYLSKHSKQTKLQRYLRTPVRRQETIAKQATRTAPTTPGLLSGEKLELKQKRKRVTWTHPWTKAVEHERLVVELDCEVVVSGRIEQADNCEFECPFECSDASPHATAQIKSCAYNIRPRVILALEIDCVRCEGYTQMWRLQRR